MEIEVAIYDWNQHIPSITLVLLPLDLSKSLLRVAKFRISKASPSETSISVQIKSWVCVKKLKKKVTLEEQIPNLILKIAVLYQLSPSYYQYCKTTPKISKKYL